MHYVIAALTSLSVAIIGAEYATGPGGLILTVGSVIAAAWILTSDAARDAYRSGE